MPDTLPRILSGRMLCIVAPVIEKKPIVPMLPIATSGYAMLIVGLSARAAIDTAISAMQPHYHDALALNVAERGDYQRAGEKSRADRRHQQPESRRAYLVHFSGVYRNQPMQERGDQHSLGDEAQAAAARARPECRVCIARLPESLKEYDLRIQL